MNESEKLFEFWYKVEIDGEIEYLCEEIKKRGYAPSGCGRWFNYCNAHKIPYIIYHHRKGSPIALVDFDFITVNRHDYQPPPIDVMLNEQATREVVAVLNKYRRYKKDVKPLDRVRECAVGVERVRWVDVFVVLDKITPIIMNQSNWIMWARDGGRDEYGTRWVAYTSE